MTNFKVPFYDEFANSTQRYKKWSEHFILFRIVTYIPFHIYDWILSEIEYKFYAPCLWCGMCYPRTKKGLQAREDCCADAKKRFGPRRGGSCAVPGGGGGYGGAVYDSSRDCYRDGCGRTYTRDD